MCWKGISHLCPTPARTPEYTVCARIEIPSALTCRYSTLWASELAMGAELFKQDTGTSSVMIYAFNTAEESNATMEDFLARHTETIQPMYDHESRATYVAEFQGFQNMFLILGGTLSLIIGLVGVLNFINAILTGILTRKREFATLQSIGMTGRQLKTMLVCAGSYYTLLALGLASALTLAAGSLVQDTIPGIFWFFTYRSTVMPILLLAPVFALLGAVVPLAVYRFVARFTIAERLREVGADLGQCSAELLLPTDALTRSHMDIRRTVPSIKLRWSWQTMRNSFQHSL